MKEKKKKKKGNVCSSMCWTIFCAEKIWEISSVGIISFQRGGRGGIAEAVCGKKKPAKRHSKKEEEKMRVEEGGKSGIQATKASEMTFVDSGWMACPPVKGGSSKKNLVGEKETGNEFSPKAVERFFSPSGIKLCVRPYVKAPKFTHFWGGGEEEGGDLAL